MIHSRNAVRLAVARALLLCPGDMESAIADTAKELGLPVETVRDVLQPEVEEA